MEYEVMVETINPCGGSKHSIREFIDVETDDPAKWVEKNGRFPILDVSGDPSGDMTIVTGDGKGYIIRYAFSA